jgi:2-polyprenyl-3-methyl-5-hydroxy-6-metoxy-1,4-benzoquinol methylase
LTKKNYIKEVSSLSWFHSIDFGDYCSVGRFRPGSQQNITLFGAFDFLMNLDLKEKSVLDIGTLDGIIAFGAKKLGSNLIFATDTYEQRTFNLSREILGKDFDDIHYLPKYQIKDLDFNFCFDVICCCGVIYHMLNPMEAFTKTRKLLKKNGFLILETPFDTRSDSVLIFNPIEKILNEPYTYFVPTRNVIEGMAMLCSFKVESVRILERPQRITYLLKAVDRDELIQDTQTPDFLIQVLKRDTCDNSFRLNDLNNTVETNIKINKIPYERYINCENENVSFPLHPPRDKPHYGSSKFESVDGNTKVL